MTVYLVWLVLIVALGLRLFRLSFQSLWWDEGHSLFVAGHALSAIPTVPAMDVHPPLYFWLLHLWMGWAGTSEFALRFLSLWFGLLTVALMYRVGRGLFGLVGGLLAVLIAATSPLYLAYSQEVRMYSLVSILSLLSVYFFYRYLHLQGGRHSGRASHLKALAFYVVATAAGLYSHYFVGFLLVFENLYWLGALLITGRWRQPGQWLKWVAGQLAILLLLAPQIYTAAHQVTSYKNVNLAPPRIADFLVECWRAFTVGVAGGSLTARWVMGVVAAILMLGLLARYLPHPDRKVPFSEVLLWLLCFVLPLGIYYVVLLDRASFSPRYMIVVTPALYVLLTYAVWQLGRRWLPLGAVAALALLAVFGLSDYTYYFDPQFYKDDTRGLARFLEGRATENDVIFIDVPHPLDYYYQGKAPESYLFVDIHTLADVLTKACQNREKLFFVRWRQSDTDPRGAVLFLLEKYGTRRGQKQLRGYDVVWYELPSPAHFTLPSDLTAAQVNFGNEIALMGQAYGGRGQKDTATEAEVSRAEAPAGRSAWVTLAWQVLKPIDEDYRVGLYLRDAAGHLIGQVDKDLLNDRHLHTSAWLPGETGINVYTLPVAPGTPPGEYVIQATVYRSRDSEPVSVLDSQGTPQGITASLGTVRVVRPAVPPKLSALSIATPVEQPLSEELLLLGYDLPKTAGEAGGVLPLSLYWQAQRNVQGDYLVQVALLDEKGELRAESMERPVGGTYTTTQWVQGEILRDRLDLRIPATVPIGSYLLRVGVVPAGPTKATAEVTLGEVKIEGRAHRFDVPRIGQPLQANFGDKIELLGYDMDEGSGRQGQLLRVVFYWRALSEMSTSYKVFTHLLGAEARIWGQKDDFPAAGTLLTTSWVKGEVVIDPYEIPLDPNIPPGSYRLEVGFYDPASGQRLPVLNAEGQPSADHVVLPAIDINSR